MPTIRDLVAVLRERDGVEAAVVLGRDGLVIDGQTASGLDAESVAALAPAVVSAAEDFASHVNGGSLTTAILEYEGKVAVISALSPDALLLVLARQSVTLGHLLFELRRNRENLATLV